MILSITFSSLVLCCMHSVNLYQKYGRAKLFGCFCIVELDMRAGTVYGLGGEGLVGVGSGLWVNII